MSSGQKISDIYNDNGSISNVDPDSLLLLVLDPDGVADSGVTSVKKLFANVSCISTFTANTEFRSNLILKNETPLSSNGPNEEKASNSIFMDDNYLYVTTSTGIIKRVALTSF